ncbi:MAG TPA: hypothetical protein VJN92_20065, partial [Candidatus Acidoferrum sp.]|nr:hypothetical protein [Candidatus Acidoferrum sp.]
MIRVKKSKKWFRPPADTAQSERSKTTDHSKSECAITTDHSRKRMTDHYRSECANTTDHSDHILIYNAVDSTKREEAEEGTAAASPVGKSQTPKPPTGKKQEEPQKQEHRKKEPAKTEGCREAWEAIGMERTGSWRFVQEWERTYLERQAGELLGKTMERCIQFCLAHGIKLPGNLFYEAKRPVEAREREEREQAEETAPDPSRITRTPHLSASPRNKFFLAAVSTTFLCEARSPHPTSARTLSCAVLAGTLSP